jgi:hypothetical protein
MRKHSVKLESPTLKLHEAVQNTFAAGKYVYLREVRDATGFDAVRTADAIAIGMYRSVGRAIHGFEMKVSRADWRKEMTQPQKAESLFRFCDTWSLIAPDEKIVAEGELPPSWGFGVPVQKRSNALPRIHWVKKPPQLKPMHYSIVFLTALIHAARAEPGRNIQEIIQAARDEGQQSNNQILQRATTKIERLQKIIDDFSRLSGVYILQFSNDADIVASAKEFKEYKEYKALSRSSESYREQLSGLYAQAERITKGLRKVLKIEEPDGKERFTVTTNS